MKTVVNAREAILNFLYVTCAITFDFANNGISVSFFQQLQIKHS